MNNIINKSTLSPLLKIAVSNGVESAIRVHVAKGDDLNARDSGGNTPLMIAAKNNRTNACRLLLESGANPDLKNLEGKTAITIADEAGAHEATEVLRSRSQITVVSQETTQLTEQILEVAEKDTKAADSGSFDVSTGVIIKVFPSGAAALTARLLNWPAAPALFSTNTGRFKFLDIASAKILVSKSDVAPGG